MTRVEITEFSDKESSLIFIAGKLREAEKAEKLLTENNIPYAIQIEEFFKPIFFGSSVMKGVAFYVLSEQYDFCKTLFYENGLSKGWIDRDQ